MQNGKSLIIIAALVLTSAPVAAEFSATTKQFILHDSESIALNHVKLIDGTGGAVLDNQTVVITDGRISAMGDSETTAIPDGVELIEAKGKTLIPGFVMVHEHFIYPAKDLGYNHQGHSFPPLYLAGGATTIRTAGGSIEDKRIRDEIDAGKIPGPKIVLTGPHINSSDWPIWRNSSTPEEAARVVSIFSDDGFPWAKAYMHLDREQLKAVIAEAARSGTRVTGHLCKVTYAEAAAMGIDNLEHGFLASTDFIPDRKPDSCDSSAGVKALIALDPEGPEINTLITQLIDAGVALTSTNTVFETFAPGRPGAGAAALETLDPGVRDHYYQKWSAIAHSNEGSFWDEALAINMQLEYRFAKAGGLLAVGTDPTGYGGVIAGYANQRALELLVEAGFSVSEAVEVATLNGARLLGNDSEIGSITVGKIADLILIDGDLSENVSLIRKTELVFKDGMAYDSKALFESVKGTVGLH
jgi:imidazolonepropionase-like amidohydrolase